MSDTVKMTEAARRRLEEEVEKLEGEGRREKAERIGIAREWGDLKENAEYHAAKDDAAMLEAKIARMRDQLRSAEIMEAVHGDTIGMGSKVTYADSGSGSGKEMTFTLVPATEADPGKGRLSIDSPVGEALSGAREGDERKLETPRGAQTVRVVTVEQP